MRIKETVLGNGLSRLEVDDRFGRTLPTHVVDEIMRDICNRKRRNEETPRTTTRTRGGCGCSCNLDRGLGAMPTSPFRHRHEDTPFRDTPREPDGIDIHVDRPRREIFCSRSAWADAMAKYRLLEDAAKECTWPCKEPMKGTEKPSHKEIMWDEPWNADDDMWDDDFDFEDGFEDDDVPTITIRLPRWF